MADFVVGGRLGLKDDGATQTVSNFKKELRESSKALIDVQDKFGATSKEALAAAKKVAQLRDSIQDAKEVADLFDPGAKFQAFGNVVRTVAGGFSAFTGAMALFGAESKEVEKALLKVQAALALTEGLNTIADATKDFQRLGAVLKGSVSSALTAVKGAFVGLRGAILATGLGAVAVALGLIVANFEKVKAAVNNMFPGLSKLGSMIGGLIQKVTDFVGVTSAADRALEDLGKTTARANEGINNRIKLLTAQGGKESEIYNLQKQQAENELIQLRENLKVKGKLTDEEAQRFRELKSEKEVLDAQESRRISEKLKADNEKYKQASDQRRRDEQEAKEKEKEFQEKSLREAAERAEETRKAALDLKRQVLKENQDVEDEFEKQLQEKKDQRLEADLARQKTANDAAEEAAKTRAENEAAQKKLDDEATAAKIANTQAVAGALGTLADIAGRETVAGKALAVSQATIDAYLGISRALGAYSPPFNFIAAAAVGAAALLNIKKIVSVKIPGKGGGGGGGSAPNVSAPAPVQPTAQVTNTRLDQNSLNQIGNAASRSYVLESDVTNNQERVTRLNRAARLG